MGGHQQGFGHGNEHYEDYGFDDYSGKGTQNNPWVVSSQVCFKATFLIFVSPKHLQLPRSCILKVKQTAGMILSQL